VQHMEWADARVWAAVPDSPADDPRLAQWLVHIHVVQHAFLAVWTGADLRDAFREPGDFSSLTEVRHWAQPYYAEVDRFLQTVSEERLGEPVTMPWAAMLAETLGREPGLTTLGDTCFQVTSHSTYHRGQVNARLRELGAEPPLVDYIAWVWFGKPAAEWRT
jgi:uncharacterized damage-inducible protein DinB